VDNSLNNTNVVSHLQIVQSHSFATVGITSVVKYWKETNIGIQGRSLYGDDIADEKARTLLEWGKKIHSLFINLAKKRSYSSAR
jgi:hypothetical protein